MSTLDEIAARDAEWDERSISASAVWIKHMLADRRYLLGLVREARGGVSELLLSYHTFNGRCTTDLPTCQSSICVAGRDLLAFLTEGSDRT